MRWNSKNECRSGAQILCARYGGTVRVGAGRKQVIAPPGTWRWLSLVTVTLIFAATPLVARDKEKISYGEGLIVNIPLPEAEVEQVVEDVAGNGVIRGTKEYNKDQYVSGAKAASSPHVFQAWTEGGKVIYKVRTEALDPRNFKDSSDVGTLEVRYILQTQGEKNTVLRINALFEEEFRHAVHPSDGSVENSEYKDIREHLDAIEVMKKQDAEAIQERKERLAKKQNQSLQGDSSSSVATAAPAPTLTEENSGAAAEENSGTEARVEVPQAAEAAADPSAPDNHPALTLEQQVKELRRQVQRVVKSPGAPLKSAPFHTAGTLQLLATGAEVLVVIDTPYWYGVETHDGQHGWMMRDELEQQP
jgi:hypothetical protein